MEFSAILPTAAARAVVLAPLFGRSGHLSVGRDAGELGAGLGGPGRRALLSVSYKGDRFDAVKTKCSKPEDQDPDIPAEEPDFEGVIDVLAWHYRSVFLRQGPRDPLPERDEQIRKGMLEVVKGSIQLLVKVMNKLVPSPTPSPQFPELLQVASNLVMVRQSCQAGHAPTGYSLSIIQDLNVLRRQVSLVLGCSLPPVRTLPESGLLFSENIPLKDVVILVLRAELRTVTEDIEAKMSQQK